MTDLDDRQTIPTHLGFRAMSTEVAITIVGGDPGLTRWAQDRVEQLESRWSRFRPDSEISRLNRAAGEAMTVSYDTLLAIHTACAAWELTGGRFDPTIHDSLLRLGYDETIDVVRNRDHSSDRGIGAAARAPGTSGSFPSPGCADIITDPTALTVRLPASVRIDLGGIGKGLAADLVAIGLVDRGAAGALVNIGGDVRAIGVPADGHAWHVAVEDPRTDRILSVIDLLDGGLATSTTLRRRWQSAGAGVHHLVAPATGQSTSSGVVGVTVAAGTAAWADALSKVPFVDPDHHESFIVASALLMYADGSMSQRGPCDLSRPGPA